MAQTGYTPILLYSSTTAAQAPAAGNLTNSTFGSELAINITDGKLFYKDNANAVQVIAWKTTPTTAGGTGLTSYTAGDLTYYASGTTLTKLAIGASTTILTSTGTAPQWSAASGVTVGTATNLAGGVAGSVPYQTAAGTTAMLAIGVSGRWLGSSGTAPQWNAPAALTKTDDTNVTLTLGGSASTALLNAASITVGWTGTLATSRGGTGLSSFNANAIVYASSTSALATSGNWSYDGTDVLLTGGNYRVNAGKGLAWSGNSAVYITPEDNVQGARIAAGGSFKLLVGGGNEAIDVNSSTRNVTITAGNVIMSNGKGIDFSATPGTGTSELFADYEEGTWTPVLVAIGGSFATNPTYTSQSGTYTKVGRFVYCQFSMTLSNKGTYSGGPFPGLGGLPFTVGANVGSNIPFYVDALTNNWIWVSLQPRAANTNGYLIGNTAAAASTAYLAANFGDLSNTTTLSGCFVYAV